MHSCARLAPPACALQHQVLSVWHMERFVDCVEGFRVWIGCFLSELRPRSKLGFVANQRRLQETSVRHAHRMYPKYSFDPHNNWAAPPPGSRKQQQCGSSSSSQNAEAVMAEEEGLYLNLNFSSDQGAASLSHPKLDWRERKRQVIACRLSAAAATVSPNCPKHAALLALPCWLPTLQAHERRNSRRQRGPGQARPPLNSSHPGPAASPGAADASPAKRQKVQHASGHFSGKPSAPAVADSMHGYGAAAASPAQPDHQQQQSPKHPRGSMAAGGVTGAKHAAGPGSNTAGTKRTVVKGALAKLQESGKHARTQTPGAGRISVFAC